MRARYTFNSNSFLFSYFSNVQTLGHENEISLAMTHKSVILR